MKKDQSEDDAKRLVRAIHTVIAQNPYPQIDGELDYGDIIYPYHANIELVGVYLREGVPTILANLMKDFTCNEEVSEEVQNQLFKDVSALFDESIPRAKFNIELVEQWAEGEKDEGFKTGEEITSASE